MESIGDYVLLHALGDGFSGQVRAGKHSKSGALAAIKMPSAEILTKKPEIRGLLAHEFEVLSTLSHPHIVRPLGFSKSAAYRREEPKVKYSAPFLALELLPNGELCEVLVETGALSQEAARYLFWQILNAIDFLHSKGLAHRDIKLENILLDQNFDAKLVDFAFAHSLAAPSSARPGTEGYLPPEAFSPDEKYGDPRAWDLFALGVCLFVMVKGNPAFVNSKPEDQFYRVLSRNPRSFWAIQRKMSRNFDPSPALQALIEGLLNPNQSERMTVKDVIANEWYNSPVDQSKVKAEIAEKVKILKEAKKKI